VPETISTQWNSVTRLFSKMAARGEKCRCSFDAIASPRPVVFPLSWKVVFFELWQCFSSSAIYILQCSLPDFDYNVNCISSNNYIWLRNNFWSRLGQKVWGWFPDGAKYFFPLHGFCLKLQSKQNHTQWTHSGSLTVRKSLNLVNPTGYYTYHQV
jgi:hypothetical protein